MLNSNAADFAVRLAAAIKTGYEIVFLPYSSDYVTYINGAGVINGLAAGVGAVPGETTAALLTLFATGFVKPWLA